MRNTKWIYKFEDKNIDLVDYDKDILAILSNRGISSKKEIEFFLNGTLNDLCNPLEFSDVEKSVERILKAKENKESVWIYGDYDVDGITSVSLCYLALKEIGVDVNYYIPLRDEGYGLNNEALTSIKNNGGNLVISVDCGISSHKEVEHCNSIGLDIIITDHHEINNGIPNSFAAINPKREDNINPFPYLSGVGTAFMLLLAIYERLGVKENIYKFLDIVAIGTIADIVPIVGYNRLLVKEGLKYLQRSKWLGLNMLLKKIFETPAEKKFDTYDVGFIIAPIFNAAGRLEDAKMAVELFISEDHVKCDELIYTLINKNSERKDIQEKILTESLNIIEEKKLENKNIIVVAKENFHHGVIGIVASKIVDRFYKPTIVMEIKPEEGIATASCRSIENFNIIEALNSMKELFVKYGGHAGAAGFSIPIENISIFEKRINDYAKGVLNNSDFMKPVKIDKELSFYKISYDLLEKISSLEPYGFGNPAPLFSVSNCHYSNFRAIGKDKNHLMLNLLKDGLEIKNCVWFNSQDMLEEIVNLKEIDVAFKLKMETFKDRYQYKIFIDDIKPSNHKNDTLKEYFDLYATTFPIETVIYSRRVLNGDEKLSLNFSNNEITVINGRDTVGYLDAQTQFLLKSLKNNYNKNFKIDILKILKKEENFNIHISIDQDNSFISYAIKEADLFKDIKQFLIKDFNYNSIQKKVLSTIFKNKNNCIVILDRYRGINTIIKTISIFHSYFNRKVLVVTSEEFPLNNWFETSPVYLPGYDFYIFLDSLPNQPVEDKNILIISTKKELELDGFVTIKDSYTLPQNIVITEEKQLFDKTHIYSKKLPYVDRLNIFKNLENFSQLYATKDILALI